jgi:hypothetical protein
VPLKESHHLDETIPDNEATVANHGAADLSNSGIVLARTRIDNEVIEPFLSNDAEFEKK